jgi:hypothetical protein
MASTRARRTRRPTRKPRTIDLLARVIPRPDISVFNFEQSLWWMVEADPNAMLVITYDHGEWSTVAPCFAQLASDVAAQAAAAYIGDMGAPIINVSRAALAEVVDALDATNHFLIAGLHPPDARAVRRRRTSRQQWDALSRQFDAERRMWFAVVSNPFVDQLA